MNEDFFSVSLGIIAVIAAMIFVGLQGFLCKQYPSEWFGSLVSALAFSVSIWLIRKKQKE